MAFLLIFRAAMLPPMRAQQFNTCHSASLSPSSGRLVADAGVYLPLRDPQQLHCRLPAWQHRWSGITASTADIGCHHTLQVRRNALKDDGKKGNGSPYTRLPSVGIRSCGRGQGHVSNFYIVDLENLPTASRRYTGDIHNSSVVGLFMTRIGQWKRLDRVMVQRTCLLHFASL